PAWGNTSSATGQPWHTKAAETPWGPGCTTGGLERFNPAALAAASSNPASPCRSVSRFAGIPPRSARTCSNITRRDTARTGIAAWRLSVRGVGRGRPGSSGPLWNTGRRRLLRGFLKHRHREERPEVVVGHAQAGRQQPHHGPQHRVRDAAVELEEQPEVGPRERDEG